MAMINKVLLIIILSSCALYTKAQVGIGTSTPSNNAMLQVESSSKGILIPRISKTARQAIASPETGLLVFQNAPDSIGFYYYNGTAWVYMVPSIGLLNNQWSTLGNAGTDTATNFLGTTDNMPLLFKVNNQRTAFFSPQKTSYFIGAGAGSKLDPINDQNIGIGDSALASNSGVSQSVAIGYYALKGQGTIFTQSNNLAVGNFAMENYQAANLNIAIGNYSLNKNQTGNTNTSIGHSAMQFLFKGSNNIALGSEALNSMDSNYNIGIGTRALYKQVRGAHNVAVGTATLYNNENKNFLTAIGDSSLFDNSTSASTNTHSTGNTAVGFAALRTNTQGYYQTAIGYRALYKSNSTGNSNTAVGYNSLSNLAGASGNTAVGSEAGLTLAATASENTAIGADALRNGTNPKYATAIGAQALKEQGTSGEGVTGIGYKAGSTYSNKDSSTFIGAYADALSSGLKLVTALGAGARVGVDNGFVLGQSRARIGIGTSYPPTNNKLTIKGLGNTNNTYPLQVVNSDSTRIFEIKDNDSIKIGSNGSFIGSIYKFSTVYDIPNLNSGQTNICTLNDIVGAISSSASVIVSPASIFNSGLVIAFARVSAAGTVVIGFTNAGSGSTNQASTTFNITIIN
jgi:trimeric autotransporter adhesin